MGHGRNDEGQHDAKRKPDSRERPVHVVHDSSVGVADPFSFPSRTSLFQRESMKGRMCKASATTFVSMSGAVAIFTAVAVNSLL